MALRGRAARPSPQGAIVEVKPDGAAELLKSATDIMIVPGYGMAVAHAQYTVAAIARTLRAKGKKVASAFTRWRAACPAT